MENRKEIGKAFRKKLDDFDRTPNDTVWDAIQSELKERKKRVFFYIPTWIKIASLFSLGALISFFIFNGFSEKNNVLNPIKSHQNTINPRIFKNSFSKKTNTIIDKNTVPNHSLNDSVSNQKLSDAVLYSKAKNTPTNAAKSAKKTTRALTGNLSGKEKRNAKKNFKSEFQIFNNPPLDTLKNKRSSTGENNAIYTKNSLVKADSTKPKKNHISPETALKDSTTFLSNKKNNLDLLVYVSPTYAGILSKHSPLDSRLNTNPKTSDIKWSYGIYLSYNATEKWSLRFGISKTNLSFITKNAPVTVSDYLNIKYSKNISNSFIYNNFGFSKTMSITQDISYTEIPLEIKYKISNKKIGVSSLFGLSYLFLDKNSIFIETENGNRLNIGNTKNLSENTFSVNAGISIDYKFARKIRVNIEPMLKYHLIDYKNNSNYINPFSIGVQTGIYFSFLK